MLKRKMTPEEEEERKKTLEQIEDELEACREILKNMAKYYVSKRYDTENSTNKQLLKKLDKICKDEWKIIEFREKCIPDKEWYIFRDDEEWHEIK